MPEQKQDNDRPIFIVGCARSGTTLLEMMLHSHPRIAMPPETRFLMKLYNEREDFGDLNIRENREAVASDIVDREGSRFNDLLLDNEQVRQMIVDGPPTLGSAIGIVLREYAARHDKPRWGDKRPNYIGDIDPLLALFPDAQIVHIIRDGRDCVASLRSMPWWTQSVPVTVNKWIRAIEAGNRAREKLKPNQYYELQYENLVAQPEVQLRALCRFLGEKFYPSMLEPHKVAKIAIPSRKLGRHHQHLSSATISSQAVGKWQEELTSNELALVEAVAERQLCQYGYALSGITEKVSEKCHENFEGLAKRAILKESEYERVDLLRAKQYGRPVQALLTRTQLAIHGEESSGEKLFTEDDTRVNEINSSNSKNEAVVANSALASSFMLVLHGPICSGKTYFARFLGKRSRLFVIGSDKIKWCLSDYSIKKYVGTGIVNNLMYRLIEEAIVQGFSVVVEGNQRLRKEKLSCLVNLCKEHNLTFLQVNIEPPLEVAEKRFAQRLERSKKSGRRLAETRPSSVPKRYQRYLDDRDPALPTLDSSTITVEDMALRIDGLLQAQTIDSSHTKTVIFDNGETRIEFYKRRNPTKSVFLTFDSQGVDNQGNKPPFAFQLISKMDVDIVAVRYWQKRSYLQDLSIEEYVSVVKPIVDTYTRKLAYGTSIGGYAALYFGSAVDSDILALAPRNSTHPVFGGPKISKRYQFNHKPVMAMNHNPHITIVYDSKLERDEDYVSNGLIPSFPNARLVKFPYAGHYIPDYLKHTGILKEIVIDAFGHAIKDRYVRKDRLKSPYYLTNLGIFCQQRGKAKWAYSLFQTVTQNFPNYGKTADMIKAAVENHPP